MEKKLLPHNAKDYFFQSKGTVRKRLILIDYDKIEIDHLFSIKK